MKLIVCADGTWCDADKSASTNVVKIYRALKNEWRDGVEQRLYYHGGVGTKWGERLAGGAFGLGVNRTVRDCYEFLVNQYQPGDELHFFGFSRGAYTVRSLAGLIRNCGIVKNRSDIEAAMKIYRSRAECDSPNGERATQFRSQCAHAVNVDGVPEIKTIGVWDTVGSLGYPLPFFGFWRHVLPLVGINWWFHDTKLSKCVKHAFQALAIHERRSDFPPALWEQDLDSDGAPMRRDQVLEQCWFPGDHTDVGGGHGANGLSDITLEWMIERARSAGLEFRELTGLAPDPLGRLHNSFTGIFWFTDIIRLRFHGRPRIFNSAPSLCESLAPSTVARCKRVPLEPNTPATFIEEI